MPGESGSAVDLRRLPSVDAVLKTHTASFALDRFGRQAVVDAIRTALAAARACGDDRIDAEKAAVGALARLEAESAPRLKPVFNLTGTVLHTNLGRALLAETAIEAAVAAMRNPVTLEFDLTGGHRGDRDDIVRGLLRELTGAEDATVVNNNAAAVLIVLNTLAKGRRAIISRGELIEIGGAFRMPQIMSRAGAQARRSWHHQPDPSEGLCRCDRCEDRTDPQGPYFELQDSRLHRRGFAARSCLNRQPPRRPSCQRPWLRHADRSVPIWSGPRADGGSIDDRRRRSCHIFR